MTLDRNAYDASNINWDKLRQLAQRVAKETKAPREEKNVRIMKTKKRKIAYGFLNLRERVETYQEPIWEKAIVDYWVLEQRNWNLESANRSRQKQERHAAYKYCLRTNGELFIREEYEDCELRGNEWVVEDENRENVMKDENVLVLDFKPKNWQESNTEYRNDRVNIHTDREASSELLFNKKGEGLTSLLNKLLEKTA